MRAAASSTAANSAGVGGAWSSSGWRGSVTGAFSTGSRASLQPYRSPQSQARRPAAPARTGEAQAELGPRPRIGDRGELPRPRVERVLGARAVERDRANRGEEGVDLGSADTHADAHAHGARGPVGRDVRGGELGREAEQVADERMGAEGPAAHRDR